MTRRPRKAKAAAQAGAQACQARASRRSPPIRSTNSSPRRAALGLHDRHGVDAGGAQPISRSRCASARWSPTFALPDDAEPAPVFKA